MFRPIRFLLILVLAALAALAGCRTAERVADTTGDAATGAAGAVGDVAGALAGVATEAYDAARRTLGASRVADDARVAVAIVGAPADTTTDVSGTVTFVELTDGVLVRYALRGLTPGEHGFHVHAVGACGPADEDGDGAVEAGGAAMGHLNPGAHEHGNPDGDGDERHAGDLGNVRAGADGRADGTRDDRVLAFDGPTSVVGKALMVHAMRDDLESDPGGMSGDRVGCGVIRLASRR